MTGIAFSTDSAWAATSSSDGTIVVWDTGRGTVLHEWPNHRGAWEVNALAFSPGGRRLVSACDRTLTVWEIDIDAAQQVAILEGHTGTVNTCAWSPDGALIASASLDGMVRVWDGHTFGQRGVCQVLASPSWRVAQDLQFSPGARYLAWISEGEDCCVWRPLKGEEPKTLRPHPDRSNIILTTTFSFDHDSRYIATAHGNEDNEPDACVVRVWDAATGSVLVVLAGHSERVSNILFSPDGRSLLSTSGEMPVSVRVWDCRTWSVEQTCEIRDVEISHTSRKPCFSPDGKYVTTTSVRGVVRLWRTGDGESVATFDKHASDTIVTYLAFSPNGRFLVSGDVRGIVHIHALSRFIGD